jgi:ribonuclease HII
MECDPCSFERGARSSGYARIAGLDEAGRGPLAGPVVAAAVILDPKRIPRGLDDSKKLDREQREKLYARVCATAQVGVAFGSRARIDRDNIRQASLWALKRAVLALPVRPRLVFVDGIDRLDLPCDCQAVVSGDALVLSIAAASIVAKVVRDRLMVQIGAAHPGYGFERHMGYSVPEHFRALARLGPTVHHRRSFAPVATLLGLDLPGDALRDAVLADEELMGQALMNQALTDEARMGDALASDAPAVPGVPPG